MNHDLTSFLASVPLFQGLEATDLGDVASRLQRVRLRGGQVLFHAGELADCVYVVVSGRLRALVEIEGTARSIGELGRGDSLGEMALITGGRRSATVRAVRDSELVQLSQATFSELTEGSPQVLLALTRRIVSQYQTFLSSPRPDRSAKIATLALLPLSNEVDLGSLPGRLASQFGSEKTLVVSGQSVDAELGAGMAQTPFEHSRNGELLDYLNALEGAHGLIVYVGEGQPSTWTSRCARQADRVLLVADSLSDPQPGAIERRLTVDGVDRSSLELVLLHREPKDLYPNTRPWLASRQVERHHHVAAGSDADLARLARLLSGRATGLVLGGGGARAFAQIGVIRALEESGCPIDLIGGTSMGAFLGAQLASGWEAERIRAYNHKCWNEVRPLKDYTFPYVSLVTGLTFLKVTKEIYGEADIEDLPVSFFCCTSNLTKATVRVCRTGSLNRWLSASIAVPGVAPPIPFEGDLFVDGSVLDNLPTDVMAESFGGSIVAVGVSPVEELSVDRELREPPSGWSLARRVLNPLSAPPPMPSIFEVLGRVTSLASMRQLAEMKRLADLYLHPPIEGFSMFDWDRIDELVELGYRYAQPLVEGWVEQDQERPREPVS